MKKANRKTWQRLSSIIALSALLISCPGTLISPAQAVTITNVVSGTVTTTTGAPMKDVIMELHTPNGSSTIPNVLTMADGTYSFTADLTLGTNYVVEPRDVDGYNKVNSNANLNNFNFDGTSHPGVNFQFIATSKTLTGTVTFPDGTAVADAVVTLVPYNIASASNVSVRTNPSGVYTATVVGGTWFAQPAVDLSEYTQRWISETPPQRVDFASDTTTQSQTLNFTVTPATGKVTVTLLNSDGRGLTTSDFNADISFRRADGVGTIRKVDASTSTVSVFLTPGIYTISAYHGDLRGKSFDPAKTTFVMTEGGSVDLGTVTAEVDSAHLKGTVTDTKNRAMGNIQVQAIQDGTTLRPSATTGSDGSFDLTVGAGTWTVGLSSNDIGHSLVAPVATTVTNGQTATGLRLQVKDLDRTAQGRVLNSAGAVITDFVGSAYVRTTSNSARVSAPVVDGTFNIRFSSSDISGNKVVLGIQAAPGADYAGGAEKKVALQGSNATQDLQLKAYDATLTGTLKLPDGTFITSPGSTISVIAVDSEGNFTSTNTASDGTFSLPLAAGTWLYDYDIEDPTLTAGLINRPAGQNSITVKAGQSVARNLTVIQGTNTITGTVKDAAGTIVARVPVTLDNRPSLENSANTNPNDLITVTVETDELGVYTAKVPNGTYLITVGETPSVPETQLAPDGKAIKVSGGSTTTINLAFTTANATLAGTVKTGKKVEPGATVTAYSSDGAQVSTTTNSKGAYSLPVKSGEKWIIIATDISGKRLVSSEPTEVSAKTGTTTTNLTVKDSGINVPGPVTKTGNADDGLSVSLPDGTNVSVPPFALDTSGTVTLSVTPTVDIDPTTLDRPASLAYEVQAFDATGREKKALDLPATIILPYTQSAVVNNGLREKGLATKYWNPQTETWDTAGASGLVDTVDNVATLTTTHLSKFAVAGTSKKKPTVSKFTLKSRTSKSMVLEVTGTNFSGKATLSVGAVKASKVQVKNGKTLLATVPISKLKNSTYDVTVTNGDGRQTIKRMTYSKGRVLGASVVRLIPR
ncbi:MAG: carboxypeptidase-like regulatory domain-containing protein [Patescibacteria group bacterium]|jgi:adhesin/invasin